MTPGEMDAVVDEHFAAEGRGDIPAILATLTEDSSRTIPGGSELLVGKPAARAWYEALYAEMEITGARQERRWHGADFLVDITTVTARAIGKPFGFDGQNRDFEFPLLHVFELAGGKISFESGWADVAAVAAQLR